MTENEQSLTRLQLDILELEARTWRQDGAKISEFRRRHPHVTEMAYYLALSRLLHDPRALEHDDRRYAPLLARLLEQQGQEIARRAGLLRPGMRRVVSR